MNPIHAVIYAAKSTEDVHGSIPDQLEKAKARAVAEGRTVAGEYQDENRSAFSENRGAGLAAAREHAARLAEEYGEAELWTLHSDRLARGAGAAPGDAQHLVEILFWGRRAGVRLRSVEDDANLDNLLLAVAQGERNYEDSRRKSAAVRAGVERKFLRGEAHGGPAPYGYQRDSTGLVPHPAEAEIVRRIYRQFAMGRSQAAIVRSLLTDEIPARRGKWHQGTVSQILRNPVHIGKVRRRSDGAVVAGHHEPLISENRWARVGQRLEAAARTGSERGRPPAGQFIFRKGMLRCAECGGAMVPRTNPTRLAGPSHFYYCYGRRQRGPDACSMPPIRRESVDLAVYSYFEKVGLDLDATREQIVAVANSRLREAQSLRRQAESDRARLDAERDRIERDYRRGAISAEQWSGLQAKIDEEAAAVAAQLEMLIDRETQAENFDLTADAETEVVAALAAIRASIAGSLNNAATLDGLRTALLRLFDGFTLHRWDSARAPRFLIADLAVSQSDGHSFILEPHVRPQAIKGWPTGVRDRRNGYSEVSINPVLEPIALGLDNDGITFVT